MKYLSLLFLRVVALTMLPRAVIAGEDFFRNKSIGGNYHYGYIWAHRESVEHLLTGHSQGAEFFFQKQTDGSKWWERVHGYPQTGFSIMYFNFANPTVVGTATAAIGYVNLPMVRSKNFLFSFQAGAGLGYLSKKFDAVTDHKNVAIGSHFNSTIRVNFLTSYKLSKNLFFHLNYGITHFSNGSFKVPNLGINNVSFSGGISYAFNPDPEFLKPEIPALNKRIITEIVYGFGVKENYPPNGNQYFAHSFYLQFLKPLSHKSMIALGADVFYDMSLIRFLSDSLSDGAKNVHVIRSGIHAGYEMPMNKFTLLIHIGYYLVDETNIDGNIYNRYGLKYQPGKRFFINLSLKSHWARADFVELGIGWRMRL
jgi:hypothetical protein